MKYSKPALTFEQQAGQLISRGLIADKNVLTRRLETVNYYRLSGYWHLFREPDNTFRSGTTLDLIWQRYVFDRQLRLLVMDGIERIEVAVKTNLIYHLAHRYGPFGYVDRSALPNLNQARYEGLLEKFVNEQARSKEDFVAHFKDKYRDHEYLPIWMATEVMTFGVLLTLFKGIDLPIKKKIAGDYGLSDWTLESWLLALNSIRNMCAHHARLWNRELGIKPKVPTERKHPEWHSPIKLENSRVFIILTIIKYMLSQIAPQSAWPARLSQLLAEYPEIPLIPMGFPENWRECPIWGTR